MFRRKNNKRNGFLILIALLLILVTFMSTWIVFHMTSKQTRQTGIYQLENISAELEHTIKEAEDLTLKLSIEAREYLNDQRELKNFIYNKKAELLQGDSGAFNVYIAGKGWDIIPDFDPPEGFVSWERQWYLGAIQSDFQCYVSSPYVDLLTGKICYTVSLMFGDRDTVLGIDFKIDHIQEHIKQMSKAGSQHAMIVTDSGIIAGFADESKIGLTLSEVYPEYSGIFSLAKSKKGVATLKMKSGHFYNNLFAARTENGWYLIVSENDWELYKNSYIQLFITIALSLTLFGIIFILYATAAHNQQKAEQAIASKEKFLGHITEKLQEPLRQILENSRSGDDAVTTTDYQKNMSGIHEAGEHLSEMIGQITSYSSIVRSENKKQAEKISKKSTVGKHGVNKRFRLLILVIMFIVVVTGLYINLLSARRLGYEMMQREAENYEEQLTEWINTQKSILDMFCSFISTHPEMLEDYEGTVDFLNRITLQYPEISVSYIANPELETPVIMNNGWKPDDAESSQPDKRQWYIDLMASERNWIISAPYYDLTSGLYCVTFAERVYDDQTGEFLGNFGIDFFMDKLIDILGDSYSDTGYAFLADADGEVINHPYGTFQMSENNVVNVSALPYAKVDADTNHIEVIQDYDKEWRLLTAATNQESNFTVYVTANVWKIYGRVFLYGMFCLVTFSICMFAVYRLLTNLIEWQDKTNLRMKEAADAAIAGEKAKGRFLAQMSHEIRTPINAVLGMNEMILRESQDSNILEYSSNIRSAGQTLLALINSILDFSKLEDGKMEIIPVNYDLAAMIHKMVVSIEERAKAKHLELVVDVDETLPSTLLGDDVRISQVIMNLLTNAVKYTEQGKIIFSLKNGGCREELLLLDVSVQDTGIGIRKEDMEKLFDSFSRLEEERNRNIEGTGLGMAIVTRLLAMMDSALKVESEYQKGSVFSFRLKQTIVDPTPIGTQTGRETKETIRPVQNGSLYAPNACVLVVDDNEMNRKVAKNLMKIYGIVPELAASGTEAIRLIRENVYEIVFLDHMMPKMDGIETLEQLQKENLLSEETTIVALTANAVVGAQEFYLDAGFDAYLSKPIEVEKLEQTLKKYLPADKITYKQEKAAVSNSSTGEDVEKNESDSSNDVLEFLPDNEDDGSDDVLEFLPDNEESAASPAADEKSTTDRLQADGISVEDGLRYCGNDREFYLEMLQDYMLSSTEKMAALSGHYENKDWLTYQTLVHALKSTSKTIGARELSEKAKAMEEAARQKDTAYIYENHDSLMQDYKTLCRMIRSALA